MRKICTSMTARAVVALATAMPAMALAPTPALAQVFFGVNLGDNAGPAAGVDIRIGYAPPPMPVYDQPPLPAPDYIWVPGHWAWSDWIDDYYFVQGYWQQPPQPGLLWTPAWWGWENGAFGFHDGYWGREVGWYGGIDYGHGYGGHGWDGGRWENGHMAYNSAVINVTNVHGANNYYQQVPVNNGPRVSYNGGAGGVRTQPSPQEMRATQAPHIAPTAAQQQRVQQAASNPHAAASQMNAGWHPPAVHRVSATGTPIPRSEALAHGGATAGAPPAYRRPPPGATPGQPPARATTNFATPNHSGTGNQPGTPPRAMPTPGYTPPPHPAPAPGTATPPHRPAPVPNTYRPAPPPTAPHPAPPPKPQPKPQPHDHEHP